MQKSKKKVVRKPVKAKRSRKVPTPGVIERSMEGIHLLGCMREITHVGKCIVEPPASYRLPLTSERDMSVRQDDQNLLYPKHEQVCERQSSYHDAAPRYRPPHPDLEKLKDVASAPRPEHKSQARELDERDFRLYLDEAMDATCAALDAKNLTDAYQEWLLDRIANQFESIFKRMRSHASNRRARYVFTKDRGEELVEHIPTRSNIVGTTKA